MLTSTNNLRHPLQHFAAVPLSRETLDEVLALYRRPNDKVSEWMRAGALEPLRRGLYLTSECLSQAPACLPLVANHLYGPSCVSLDFALAWHGLIPERVAEVTSATPRPSRILHNARGRFSYHHLPLHYYTVGQELGASNDGFSFLIASPAKALCDRLVLARDLPLLSRGGMRQWLLNDLRLDPELLSEMDLSDVSACLATGFKHRQLGTLLAVLKPLQLELAG